jgi:hypothetical protein
MLRLVIGLPFAFNLSMISPICRIASLRRSFVAASCAHLKRSATFPMSSGKVLASDRVPTPNALATDWAEGHAGSSEAAMIACFRSATGGYADLRR